MRATREGKNKNRSKDRRQTKGESSPYLSGARAASLIALSSSTVGLTPLLYGLEDMLAVGERLLPRMMRRAASLFDTFRTA